ncbi:hypothetical protein [Nitrospina gracilis]|uniref:hypothetical protein n=1 Tax=Nitrospina gracilis TaxID=35801 RepID=UPI001F23957A|nr:hypothetical protein [Nitrospina gracilis]MCF8721832.1 hypothetical protein [Nitrospina gracilis Nb-211]
MKRIFLGLAGLWFGLVSAGFAHAGSLEVPHPHYGLSIGNSETFNGLRFNLADENVKAVRGMNFTVFNWEEHYENAYTLTADRIDGLALGLMGPRAREINGLALGCWLTNVDTLRGINIAPVHVIGGTTTGFTFSLVHTLEEMNGISVGMVTNIGQESNGILIGLLYLTSPKVNGLVIQGLFSGKVEEVRGVSLEWGSLAFLASGILAGLAVGPAPETPASPSPSFSPVGSKKLTGLMIGGYNVVEEQQGVLLGLFGNSIKKGSGLQIGSLFNTAKSFDGVQVGFINHIEENPFLFRWMPGINFHFGGDEEETD